MNDRTTFAAGVAESGGTAPVARPRLWRRTGRCLAGGHAIAHPGQTDPLPRVLRRGLGGLTVPVTPGPLGELFLGPGSPRPGRTLRRLVLAPLFRRAASLGGRVFAAQRAPFHLVVEITGTCRDAEALLLAYRLLDQQLRDHAPLVSRCESGTLTAGAVSVTVTGIVDVRALLAAQPLRYAFAGGCFDDVGSPTAPPELVPVISEPWSRRFGWDGREPIPAEERHQLHALVRAAHEDGRTVRIAGLAGGPRRARAAVWSELRAAGVDVIADADQRGLARLLRRQRVAVELPGTPPAGFRAAPDRLPADPAEPPGTLPTDPAGNRTSPRHAQHAGTAGGPPDG